MPPAIVTATIQSALLSGLSNVLAQGITAYRSEEAFVFNAVPLMHFILFTLLSCPPNFLWQEFLEEKFPAYVVELDGQQRLDKLNTARKFFLDQTLGAVINTVLFIAAMGAFKGKDSATITRDCRRDVVPLMVSGWKLWPLVSLFNFTLVPARRRVLVGSVVGLFWGIYLSIFVAG